MNASTSESRRGMGAMSGISPLDIVVKVGLFALSVAVFMLGVGGTLPVSFYTAVFVSMFIGFVLLNIMGRSIDALWADFVGK